MAPTYESASTKMFRLGRTDTIRTASIAAKAFCESMKSKEISVSTLLFCSSYERSFVCMMGWPQEAYTSCN